MSDTVKSYQELFRSLDKCAVMYFEAGVESSVKNNKHMNNISDEDVFDIDYKGVIEKFLEDFKTEYSGSFMVREVIFAMTGVAKNFCNKTPNKFKDAVIVDFCNFTAFISGGMDLAFYTGDLR